MSDFTFSVVTSIFTVGGLMGSMVANLVMDRWGRKGATRISAFLITSGAAIMGLSTGVPALVVGRLAFIIFGIILKASIDFFFFFCRLFIGIGSGVGLCVGPIYLAEIAPPRIGGNVGKSLFPAQLRSTLMFHKGVLTQLAIVLGIMITQAVGLRLATPTQWRVVLFLSFILSAAQLLLSPAVAESPAWLEGSGHPEESAIVRRKLWGLHVAIGTPALNKSPHYFPTF